MNHTLAILEVSHLIENNPTNIVAAFEILLEEIETEIDFCNRGGAQAFEGRDYEQVKVFLDRAAQITSFRDKVDVLRREWENQFSHEEDEKYTDIHAARSNLGRLRRGVRTGQKAFYRPILEALQTLGGSATIHQVLDHVLQSMRGTLKDVDFELLTSVPDLPRWKNTAQWARNSMVKEGLLRDDSPRGIWQISDSGIRLLRSQREG